MNLKSRFMTPLTLLQYLKKCILKCNFEQLSSFSFLIVTQIAVK